MRARSERTSWVSYLRVSTSEQADRELSLPAQRHAVEDYANRHGVTIAREYLEAGCSGSHPHRPAFRRMLEDVFRPGSDVAAIVVNHTSRFTRDATEARVVKAKLHRIGVRVLSACQELADDPMGKLMEGLFECIDQYESELKWGADVGSDGRGRAARLLPWRARADWLPARKSRA
jgi:DNA invertase Pin-like site-specific DNA recombinase